MFLQESGHSLTTTLELAILKSKRYCCCDCAPDKTSAVNKGHICAHNNSANVLTLPAKSILQSSRGVILTAFYPRKR
jgi:hypothetical protein